MIEPTDSTQWDQMETCLRALERLAPALVGSERVWEIQNRLAKAMLMEALRRTSGNYTRAAELLGVRRQAVQQMVARFSLDRWAAHLRLESDTLVGRARLSYQRS